MLCLESEQTAEGSVVSVQAEQSNGSSTCSCHTDFSFLLFDQYGMGSSTKASFTPFVDPRVYQTSPTDEDEEDDESSATGKQAGVLQIGFLSCKTQGQDSPTQVTPLIADAQSLDKDTLKCITLWSS